MQRASLLSSAALTLALASCSDASSAGASAPVGAQTTGGAHAGSSSGAAQAGGSSNTAGSALGGSAGGTSGTETASGGIDAGGGTATAGSSSGGGSGGAFGSGGSTNPPELREGCEPETFEGHSYALCRDRKVPFPEARADCEAMGMQLIRLDSAAESAWIYETFYAKPLTPGPDSAQMWTGATDNRVEGEWRWLIGDDVFWRGKADGTAQNGLYAHWGRAHAVGVQDQPNDAHSAQGEDCMIIRAPDENEGGHWTDIDCGAENDPPVTSPRLAWYTCEALP